MKKLVFFTLLILTVFYSCTPPKEEKKEEIKEPVSNDNPFFSTFNTPHNVPPFDLIKPKHFIPAFERAMKIQKEHVDGVINNTEAPTFANTIEALEASGEEFSKVRGVFYNLNGANTSPELQKISKEIAPKLSKHADDISLNGKLFEKVKSVYENKDQIKLNEEQATLLENTYKSFLRNGANLNDEQKNRFREINKELSLLSLKFGENVLAETNKFKLVIDKEEDLAGLPETVKQGAAEAATEAGMNGKWLFTLHKPSLLPFLQYSANRELREKIYTAYINVGNNNNEFDNKEIVTKIVKFRAERANLLGYENHAAYMLENRMAKKADNVYDLLDKVLKPTIKMAKNEVVEMQKLIDKERGKFKLQPWDWWYYAEKVKKAKYALDEEMLRPYFKLENVIDAAFMVANKLYGITIEERTDIPKYHPDVKTFEVKEADGSHIGIFYADYHPRASKRGGAWSSSYRGQFIKNGEFVHPVVTNVCNFSKPTADKPALLSVDEVTTLFHEFGHGLHSLLGNCQYRTTRGEVARDFVELPSQIMENWSMDPEVLKMYAKHYETGEVISDELIDKMQNSAHFNQGFTTLEYLAASYLDMKFFTIDEPKEIDVLTFEKEAMDKIGLIEEIAPRYRSTYFRHIFAGGYSAGYYSYIWSETLDADAFAAFKESGDLFNKDLAAAFRKEVLSKGGGADPAVMYKRFRGADPKIEAMLKRKGLI